MNDVQRIIPKAPDPSDENAFLLWLMAVVMLGLLGALWWLVKERANGRPPAPPSPVKDIEAETKKEVDETYRLLKQIGSVVLETDAQRRPRVWCPAEPIEELNQALKNHEKEWTEARGKIDRTHNTTSSIHDQMTELITICKGISDNLDRRGKL